MRSFIKIILLLAIAFSLAWIPEMFSDFKAMTAEAETWIGPEKTKDSIIHFFVTVAAFIYLIFQTIPACIGWILAFERKKAAFWLILLPGFIGLIVAGAIFGLLYTFDPSWTSSWGIAFIIGLPALIYTIAGQILLSRK